MPGLVGALAEWCKPRDGKIWQQVDYFGPPFEAPAWRAPYAEVETQREGG
jgi:hypothetical protein